LLVVLRLPVEVEDGLQAATAAAWMSSRERSWGWPLVLARELRKQSGVEEEALSFDLHFDDRTAIADSCASTN
jgi:hypothetical protein